MSRITTPTKPMNIIAAVDANFGIGKNNSLPWHLKEEYQHFQRQTTLTKDPNRVNALVMGRRCWESIPQKFRPLKNRINIVLSRTMEPSSEKEVIITRSLEDALNLLSNPPYDEEVETIWNIGGREIYALGLNHPALYKMVLTRLEKAFNCDVYFPEVNWADFELNNDFPPKLEQQHIENGITWHVTSYTNKNYTPHINATADNANDTTNER